MHYINEVKNNRMKTLKLIACGIFLLLIVPSYAQVAVNVNIGTAPSWGPVITNQEYYYLPDIESYYDIRNSQFIFLNNGVWIRSTSLPSRYRSYNLNTGYVVVVNDYHGRNPYVNFKSNKVKYYKKNNGNGNFRKERSEGNSNHGEKKNEKGNKHNKGKD